MTSPIESGAAPIRDDPDLPAATTVEKQEQPQDTTESNPSASQDKGKGKAVATADESASTTDDVVAESSNAAEEETTRRQSDARTSLSSFSIGLSIDSDTISDIGDVDSIQSSITARSSVYEFVEQYGRTYHKYKEGKYLLPNDEQEQNRLDLQHHIALRLLEGKLYLAPIEQAHRVLDMATGTGIWAMEFAEQHPESDVLGTDLSPIQPEYVPPNLRFEIDDVEDDWVYSRPFDFIHGRYICPSLRDVPRMLRQAYANLRPGGYLEIMETLMVIEAIDDSLKDTSLPRWHDLMLDGVKRMGRDPMVPLQVRRWMAEAGFIDVVEKKYAVPANPWARGQEQKIRGTLMMTNLLEAASGITHLICGKVWGWTPEQVEVFLIDVRADLKNRAHHGYVPILVVHGRKPL